jgi:hypothetical protein
MSELNMAPAFLDGYRFARLDLDLQSTWAPVSVVGEGDGAYVALVWMNPEARCAAVLMLGSRGVVADSADMIVDRVYREVLEDHGIPWRGVVWVGRDDEGGFDQYLLDERPGDGTWYPLLRRQPCRDRSFAGFVVTAAAAGIQLTWHRDGVLSRTIRDVDLSWKIFVRAKSLGRSKGEK